MRIRSAPAITTVTLFTATLLATVFIFANDTLPEGRGVSRTLDAENAELGISHQPATMINDLTFLRRIYIDLIGRIPTDQEIRDFAAMPSATRRATIVDQLLDHERFADTKARGAFGASGLCTFCATARVPLDRYSLNRKGHPNGDFHWHVGSNPWVPE